VLCNGLSELIFCTWLYLAPVNFGFISFVRRKSTLSQTFFNKRYLAPLTCVFYLRHSSNWNPHRLHSEPFFFTKRKTQRRAPPIRKSNVFKSLQYAKQFYWYFLPGKWLALWKVENTSVIQYFVKKKKNNLGKKFMRNFSFPNYSRKWFMYVYIY
jgi:hypothetical protein